MRPRSKDAGGIAALALSVMASSCGCSVGAQAHPSLIDSKEVMQLAYVQIAGGI